MAREVFVHLIPDWLPAGKARGGIAVFIDVLRATTTMVYALAAGCTHIQPVENVEDAQRLADNLPAGKVLLCGERGGVQLPGFDLGNSPAEYTARRCKGMILVLTTTNGTRALFRAIDAERVIAAAFVNFSAVCEQLAKDARPVHIVCAGSDGEVTLEDTLLAGALVDFLCEDQDVTLNDSARLAWDCFENHGSFLQGTLELSKGGRQLSALGMEADIRLAAEVDKFHLVPEVLRDPLRLEIGSVGVNKGHWNK